MESKPYSNMFEEILKKPALYVGNCSVSKIKTFMDGYIYAKWEEGKNSETDPYKEFGEWVRNRFQIKTSHGWADIVQFMSPDDAYAFEMTKKLWEEYKSQLHNQADK
jgi:hypothetical protein